MTFRALTTISSRMVKSLTSAAIPPRDGSIHPIFGIVDWQAERNPSRPYLLYPKDGATGDLTAISYSDFALATHRMAHIIRPNGKGEDGEVVAILANCDAVLYLAVVAGISRSGWVPFMISPRNSPEAVVSMLKKTSTHRILYQASSGDLILTVKALLLSRNYHVELEELPSFLQIYPSLLSNQDGTCCEASSYQFEDAVGIADPVIWFHSSGSTGFPKPIPCSRVSLTQWASSVLSVHADLRWAAFSAPTFHCFGYCIQHCIPLFSSEAVGIFGPRHPEPSVIPTVQSMLNAAKITNCTALSSIPSFLEVRILYRFDLLSRL